MTDLPDPVTLTPVVPLDPIQPISSGNKEAPSISTGEKHEALQDATGQEFELPKEVVASGVRMQPTTVAIPAPVAKLGVKPAGDNVPTQTSSSVVLPLSDDQIAKGLHEGITNSMRWLAEWCVRRLKHLHISLKNVHGSFVRVKE